MQFVAGWWVAAASEAAVAAITFLIWSTSSRRRLVDAETSPPKRNLPASGGSWAARQKALALWLPTINDDAGELSRLGRLSCSGANSLLGLAMTFARPVAGSFIASPAADTRSPNWTESPGVAPANRQLQRLGPDDAIQIEARLARIITCCGFSQASSQEIHMSRRRSGCS